jgi:hypothetical protein
MKTLIGQKPVEHLPQLLIIVNYKYFLVSFAGH